MKHFRALSLDALLFISLITRLGAADFVRVNWYIPASYLGSRKPDNVFHPCMGETTSTMKARARTKSRQGCLACKARKVKVRSVLALLHVPLSHIQFNDSVARVDHPAATVFEGGLDVDTSIWAATVPSLSMTIVQPLSRVWYRLLARACLSLTVAFSTTSSITPNPWSLLEMQPFG